MENKTEIKEVTPEFVQYIKERDAAREEAKKALEELRETQCRLYDAVQEIERLEKVFIQQKTLPNFRVDCKDTYFRQSKSAMYYQPDTYM